MQQGVPCAREYGGVLVNRSFGGVQVQRTFYARGQTGQQLLLAAYAQLNKMIHAGKVKMFTRHEMMDLVLVNQKAKGIIARDLQTGELKSFAADAVVLATGGYSRVFRLSTLAIGCNGSAIWKAQKESYKTEQSKQQKNLDMRSMIDFKTAILSSLNILGILALFHIAILVGILFFDYVPKEFFWGGQIKTEAQFINFEIVSLLATILIILLLFIRSKRLHLPKLYGATRLAMWLLFVLFSLNTIGNLLAATPFESLFSLVSGLLAFLFLRIAIEKKHDEILKNKADRKSRTMTSRSFKIPKDAT